jgi:hypothetical protein
LNVTLPAIYEGYVTLNLAVRREVPLDGILAAQDAA